MTRQRRTAYGAFTLVELLVVLAIIGMITALVMPVSTTVLRSVQLTQAGQMVSDQMALARQTALSKNRVVQVRFYRFGDATVPGENSSSPSSGKYRALQVVEVQDSGAARPLTKVLRLPGSTIIDRSEALSTILNQSQRGAQNAAAEINVPGVENAYEWMYFSFLPNGSTDLVEPGQPGKAWFLTLHDTKDGDNLSNPPKNFSTIQVDAYNGKLHTYRP